MKITRRQIRKIIKEAMVQSYDLGREDSLAGIRPQLPDEDYMRGYNDAQMDAGLPTMQAPGDSGRGKKLDPNLLKGALPGKIRGMTESRFTSRMPMRGPMAEIGAAFEELGDGMWKYKMTGSGGTFQLPTGDNPDHGYFVMVEYNRGIYNMRWIQRVPTNERQYVKVIRPRNGWEVESVPRDIKNAVDEIMYDIARHEAEPENWSPGAGNAN